VSAAGGPPRAALLAPLKRCARGETPSNVALMHLLCEATSPAEAEAALVSLCDLDGEGGERVRAVRDLWHQKPSAWATVKGVLGRVEHGGEAESAEAGIARWASLFDGAAQAHPEGSVALYGLGDPELLQAATAEIVTALDAWGLLGPDRDVLDLGCGIGRVAAALSPRVRSVAGLDIAPAMIAAARARSAGIGNLRFLLGSGRDLAPFADRSLDLVLAVDSFPYLVQSGEVLAEKHVAEAARALRPGGSLVILNYSYRGDDGRDRAELGRLADAHGFTVVRAGERPFALWDGHAFHLRRVLPLPEGEEQG
jgi:SAM-dependent methyltransferase